MWRTEEEAKKCFCPFKICGLYCKASECSMWIYTENSENYNHNPQSYYPHSNGIINGEDYMERYADKELYPIVLHRWYEEQYFTVEELELEEEV